MTMTMTDMTAICERAACEREVTRSAHHEIKAVAPILAAQLASELAAHDLGDRFRVTDPDTDETRIYDLYRLTWGARRKSKQQSGLALVRTDGWDHRILNNPIDPSMIFPDRAQTTYDYRNLRPRDPMFGPFVSYAGVVTLGEFCQDAQAILDNVLAREQTRREKAERGLRQGEQVLGFLTSIR